MRFRRRSGSGALGLFVAGVGRSGTSVATQALVRMGLRGPVPDDRMPANEWNPTGYWESTSLADLNDRLLARLGGNWWAPPDAVDLTALTPYAEAGRAAFAQAFPAVPVASGWVWKDPRLTVLLPFWEQVLGVQPVLVPFRDPRAVADSVSRRDGLTLEQSLVVWERHTRLLLRHLAGRRVLVLSYDTLLGDRAAWARQLEAFLAGARLPARAARLDDLLVPSVNRVGGTLGPEHEALAQLLVRHAAAHERFPALTLPAPSPGLLAAAPVTAPAWTGSP